MDGLDVLCPYPTRDLFAIAKFLLSTSYWQRFFAQAGF